MINYACREAHISYKITINFRQKTYELHAIISFCCFAYISFHKKNIFNICPSDFREKVVPHIIVQISILCVVYINIRDRQDIFKV